MISLRPYQSEAIERLRDGYRAGHQRQVLVSPTGSGKCLGRGTPVLMFDGSIRAVESITAGDFLMGPDSKPRKVISTSFGREEMFRISPVKGDSYVVNRSHILSLKICGNPESGNRVFCSGRSYSPSEIANVSVDEYLDSNKTFRWCAKGWRTGVQFSEKMVSKFLPPYILGLWLGDGDSKAPTFTKPDSEIATELSAFASEIGLNCREEVIPEKCTRYHITPGRQRGGRGHHYNPVKKVLLELNLIFNKHVPEIYKINSEAVRLEVLAGLIDSDGYYSTGSYDWVSKFPQLAEDFCFLARSLGFAAYKKIVRKQCCNNGVWGTYYRVSLSGDVHRIPCRIPRKQAKPRFQKKDVLRTGISVESIGEGDYFGFELDGDGLFLLGDFTVTHNTILFSFVTKGAVDRGQRVLIVTHRREIMGQICRALDSVNVPRGTITAGSMSDRHNQVQVASVQTLVRRFDQIHEPDFIVIDEVHHLAARQWSSVLARYNRARVLGVTATPERLDGRGLGEFFSNMVLGPSVQWLIDNKFLARPVYYAPPPDKQADVSQLKKTAGDFNCGDAVKILDTPTITGSAVEHYRKLCAGKKAIAFCHSVDHAEHVAAQFCAAGIPAASVDGKLKDDVRAARMRALEDGTILVLTSCELVSEGVDIPTVNAAILLRVTASLALALQQIGRALRPKPDGSPAYVLDHVGNVLRHGLAEEPRDWSLEGHAKKKRVVTPLVEARQCSACFAIFAGPSCPQCGTTRDVQGRLIHERDGELVLLTSDQAREIRQKRDLKAEEWRCRTLNDWRALAQKRGYEPGWAYFRWKNSRYHPDRDDRHRTVREPELAI